MTLYQPTALKSGFQNKKQKNVANEGEYNP